MGRIFEVRKSTMFARWDRMAKQFTRIGKEIAIAVKTGGPDPATNPVLRRCFANARGVGPSADVQPALANDFWPAFHGQESTVSSGPSSEGAVSACVPSWLGPRWYEPGLANGHDSEVPFLQALSVGRQRQVFGRLVE